MGYKGFEHDNLKERAIALVCMRGGWVWNTPTGSYFTRSGTPMKVNAKGHADIIGLIYGRALAIEVKTGSGRLNPDQKAWRDQFLAHGGLYIQLTDIKKLEEFLNGFEQHKGKSTWQLACDIASSFVM